MAVAVIQKVMELERRSLMEVRSSQMWGEKTARKQSSTSIASISFKKIL